MDSVYVTKITTLIPVRFALLVVTPFYISFMQLLYLISINLGIYRRRLWERVWAHLLEGIREQLQQGLEERKCLVLVAPGIFFCYKLKIKDREESEFFCLISADWELRFSDFVMNFPC